MTPSEEMQRNLDEMVATMEYAEKQVYMGAMARISQGAPEHPLHLFTLAALSVLAADDKLYSAMVKDPARESKILAEVILGMTVEEQDEAFHRLLWGTFGPQGPAN